MIKKRYWPLLLLIVPALAAKPGDGLARKNGPAIDELRRLPEFSAHELLAEMFQVMEIRWFLKDYAASKQVDFRATLGADLPLSSMDKRFKSGDSVDFDITLDGIAAPNGMYRIKMEGGLGQVDLINNLKRRFVSSQDFKSFSDTPIRARSENANLDNYRSYILRYVGRLKQRILESGAYRTIYVGSGTHQGRDVHVVRVYKPGAKGKPSRAPMSLRKLWTFWHDGGYEFWIYQTSKLPAVVFYTNVDDNVYANFEIDYNKQWLPSRIDFRNNSLKSEGQGDVVLGYNRQGVLNGLSLKFDGDNGVSFRFDATLAFKQTAFADLFRVIPPFGFKKINRDHLKLMLLTQVSGGLLKLKKHGVNFKNFKF